MGGRYTGAYQVRVIFREMVTGHGFQLYAAIIITCTDYLEVERRSSSGMEYPFD